MVKIIDSVKKFFSGFVYSGMLFIFAMPFVINAQDWGCPEPINYQFTARWSNSRIIYACPGQLLTLSVFITNDISPCCDPGDFWPYCGVMDLTSASGSGWIDDIPQGSSDCRTQTWQIPIPFDNNDEDIICANYAHYKAGGLLIYVIGNDNPDQCKTSAMDPVNTWTGALNFGDGDYTNSDLAFSRSYNSRRLVQTYARDTIAKRWQNPLGIGWQHNYNIYIEEIQQSNPTVYGCLVHEGMQTNVYKKLASGNYHPKRGNHSNLTKSGNTWKLYKPDDEVYYFGSSNKVDSIVDRNGRKTTFSYSGSYLSQVTGKDNHTLNFSYDADSLLRWVSVTENSNTKKIEYRYAPATFITHADSDTFDLKGTYYLTQILQHYPTGNADSLMSLHKYYYNNSNLSLAASILPQDQYTQSDTTWKGNYKKGNRLYVWYDSLGQVIYEEVINGDGDTLLTNDKTTYKAYTKYYRVSQTGPRMDSSLTYVYQQEANLDSVHNPYDTTFTPQPPTSNYSIRKYDYHNDVLGRKIFIETRPNADSASVTKYYKDKDFNDTLVISPDNDTTKYVYKTYTLNDTTKSSPNPTKIKYPTGDSSLLYYHAPIANAPSFFLTDSSKDELSRKTKYFYDGNYNLDSLQYVSRYVAGIGTTNITTDYTYNSRGNLTRIKDPLGDSTYFSYAPNDTGPYLTQTRIDFSPSGSGNEDIITKYKYNTDIGKMDTLIYFRDYPGDSSIVRYTYDVLNRSKDICYPDGTREIFIYDKRGNLLKKTTYEGLTCHFKIEYEYDARNRLTKVKEYKDAASSSYDSTRYKYNLDGDLISFMNTNDTTGLSTEVNYEYDADRLKKVVYPDTTNDSLGYYKDGNLKFKRDRKGKVIAYVYDRRDRLTRKRYFNSFTAYQGFPDSVPAETLAFAYDKVGNMITMVDKNGTVGYSYDEVDGLDTLDCYQNMLIVYEYDKGGNRRKLKVVNAADTTNVYYNQSYPSYDEANRLKNTVVGTDTFAFQYWDTGPIKKLDYPNGIKEKYLLTSRNFIDVMTDSGGGNQLFKFDYGYNELGDRDSLIFYLSRPLQSALSGTVTYSYDDLRRLTQAQYPRSIYGKTNKYTYDKTGNRLKKIAGTDTANYTYNKRNNQLTGEGGNVYAYDDNGNLTEIHLTEAIIDYYYTWDFENRLVKVKRAGSGGNDSLRMTYCGLGKRIRKIHGTTDTTNYAYDGMYAVCEFGGHLDLKAKYVYANGMLLARYDASSADSHYYHHDGLGSIMGMTNENGSVEQSYFYDEFGNSLGSWGSVSNHYLYTGQEYDADVSGAEQYNLRARYYKTGIGRFISEDPILPGFAAFPLGANHFIYVVNNPLNATDPSGRIPQLECKTTISHFFRHHQTRCWNTYGEWVLKTIIIMESTEYTLGGSIDCSFESENISHIQGTVSYVTRWVTVCHDPCGDLAPQYRTYEKERPIGKYSENKTWAGACTFRLWGEWFGGIAEDYCEANKWKCPQW